MVALDDVSPTRAASLLRPAELLGVRHAPVVVLAPLGCAVELRARGLELVGRGRDERAPSGPAPRLVLATSHAAGAGLAAWRLAADARAPFLVVQHGVVTPYAPPLPPGSHLLAWSREDAAYWAAGRPDVATTVVGSEILWEASRSGAVEDAGAEPTCFLGQLHGAELRRDTTVRTVAELAGRGPLSYRPHPAETDLASRVQHARWRRRGVAIETARRPLVAERGTVTGIFSTGILEAAASGHRAYAFCVAPPRWVEELWSRYGMARLGDRSPTAVDVGAEEPASVIADAAEALR